MAVLRGRRRDERGVRRARPPRRRRQRELLQRVARPRHRPHAGGRCRRPDRRPRRSPPAGRSCTTATRIVLLGHTEAELGGSEWATPHDLRGGLPPAADLDVAAALHDLVRDLVVGACGRRRARLSDGGLAVALAEMAIGGATGFDVSLDQRAGPLARVVLGVGVARRRRGRPRRRRRPGGARPRRRRARQRLGIAGGDRLVVAAPSTSRSPTPPTPGATPSPTRSAPTSSRPPERTSQSSRAYMRVNSEMFGRLRPGSGLTAVCMGE